MPAVSRPGTLLGLLLLKLTPPWLGCMRCPAGVTSPMTYWGMYRSFFGW